MQVEKDKEFAKRSLYYTSKSYVEQIDKGEKYRELQKVYFIGILNFAILDTPEYISRHLILDEKTLKQEIADFEFTFIELQKFELKLDECDTLAKKWIYFIQNADNFELIPKEYQNIQEFKTAFEIAKKYNWTKQELEIYDKISLKDGVNKNVIQTAHEDGIEKGIEQGIEQRNIEIAKTSIKQGLDNKTISLITGLNEDNIESFR